VVISDLPHAIDDESAIKLDDIGVLIAKFISRSIAANDYILGHAAS
jgi:hypothetical protein